MARLGSGRFYFYQDGKQLLEHPLHGAIFEGCGAYVDPKRANCPNASDYDKRRTSISVFTGKGYETKQVTCADFGNRPVLVVNWFPNVEARSRFMMVPEV